MSTPTNYEAPTTNAAPVADPTAPAPWSTWPDWVNLVLAAYLAFAPLWTAGAPAGWFVTLGIIGVVVALWALATGASKASEWVQIVVGAVVFLAPWMGGFSAATGAAWTAWIIGIALIVFSAVALSQYNKESA